MLGRVTEPEGGGMYREGANGAGAGAAALPKRAEKSSPPEGAGAAAAAAGGARVGVNVNIDPLVTLFDAKVPAESTRPSNRTEVDAGFSNPTKGPPISLRKLISVVSGRHMLSTPPLSAFMNVKVRLDIGGVVFGSEFGGDEKSFKFKSFQKSLKKL